MLKPSWQRLFIYTLQGQAYQEATLILSRYQEQEHCTPVMPLHKEQSYNKWCSISKAVTNQALTKCTGIRSQN